MNKCRYYDTCPNVSGWCNSSTALNKCVTGLNWLVAEQCSDNAALEAENTKLKEEVAKLKRHIHIDTEETDKICITCGDNNKIYAKE